MMMLLDEKLALACFADSTARAAERARQAADPDFTTTIRQLEASQVNNSSACCILGGFTEVRDILASALEAVVTSEIELEPAITNAAERSNEVNECFNNLIP